MSEWISVKERLPEDYSIVLTFDRGEYSVLEFVLDERTPNGAAWDAPDGWRFPLHSVTHWMPLPSPPGEEGE